MRSPTLAACAAAMCLLVACGSDDAATTRSAITGVTAEPSGATSEAPADDAASPAEETVASVTAPPATVAPTTAASPTVPPTTVPAAVPFDGPSFTSVAEPRIAALGAPVGQLLSPAALAAVFELPADAPVLPERSITGVMQHWEVDSFDDSSSEERIVGVDGAGDQATLQAFADSAPTAGVWSLASVATSGDLTTLLYTDPSGGRYVIVGDGAPDAGAPGLQYEDTLAVAELPMPVWAAALPVPDGGQLVDVLEGVGAVARLGTLGGGGVLSMTLSYPPEAAADLADGILPARFLGAGFELLESPISNLDARVDVRMGGWEGTIGIGEVTSGDQLIAVQVVYAFHRTAG